MASTPQKARGVPTEINPTQSPAPATTKDLKSVSSELFHDFDYSDLTIRCKGHVWRCHRTILCPRCPFFKAACDSEFIESENREIKLDGDDPNAVEMFLLYFYTLEAPAFGKDYETACRASVIGDKYDAEGLKNAGEARFLEKMDYRLPHFGSMIEICKNRWISFFDDLYEIDVPRIEVLRPTAIRYMVYHAEHLMGMKAGQKLLEKKPEFMYDLLRGMAEKIAATGKQELWGT